MSTHATLSPSGAHRWGPCPGSIELCKDFERDVSSGLANEGTIAHALAAQCLTHVDKAENYIGEIWKHDGTEVLIDKEFAGYVQEYLDYVKGVLDPNPGKYLTRLYGVEKKLPIEEVTGEKDAKGTVDFYALDPETKTIYVVDFKFGRGVAVSAFENEQLAIYAKALLNMVELTYDIDTVVMTVYQPRKNNVDTWIASVDELSTFLEPLLETGKRILAGEVMPRIPGLKQCQFCPAANRCTELRDYSLMAMLDDFIDYDLPLVPQIEPALTRTMDNTLLGQCLLAVEVMEVWCKAIRARVEAELFAGADVPGFKLVQGRDGNREWIDENAVETYLKKSVRLKSELMYDTKLISYATAKKLAKEGVLKPNQWKVLQDEIVRSDGRPLVVPVTDKRPALIIKPSAEGFYDLDDLLGTDDIGDLV